MIKFGIPTPPSWPQRRIARVAPGLRVWGYVSDLSLDEVIERIRNWGAWLEDRGCITVANPANGSSAEFRKRRFKTRPELLTFRFRNDYPTRAFFADVRRRFDSRKLPYEVELTPKRKHPRAVAVPLRLDDVLAGQAARDLLRVALDVGRGDTLHLACAGRFRTMLDPPPVALLGQSRSFTAGFALGRAAARTFRRSP
jgi:hypothetical protein